MDRGEGSERERERENILHSVDFRCVRLSVQGVLPAAQANSQHCKDDCATDGVRLPAP